MEFKKEYHEDFIPELDFVIEVDDKIIGSIMVICTIVTGIISQDSLGALKRVSVRIIAYYIITTILACFVGIIVASILQPGSYANFAGLATQKITGSANVTVASFFKGLFSTNMVQTFASGNIVQTLVIAIFLGVAILKMKNEEHKDTMLLCVNHCKLLIVDIRLMFCRRLLPVD